MTGRFGIVAAVIVVVAVLTLAVGATASGTSVAVEAIDVDSACPATGCASGACHGYSDVPEPDGVHELTCPVRDCSSLSCHHWDNLTSSYRKASDASLNLWILLPSLLIGAIVLAVRRS
ncbi:MAG: hypothetical protein LKH29_02805 [Eggerthellaceae bacterium]|jgi:hypothetical protein|nr:hypothetical protein [Eggerthellaceae bacterium]